MAARPAQTARRRSRTHDWFAPLLLTSALLALALLAGCGDSGAARGRAASGRSGATLSRVASQARPSHGRPNIVFVLTDDLAWNLVRYMPHVLRMQRDGETFSNYFVTDSLCCPSRASILTGRFPHDTRVYDNSPPEGGYSVFHARGEERQTFALALQRAGYRTALMGKYLNGYRPAATEGGRRPYVPPGWNEWDVAGNGYPEYGYRMNSDGRVRAYGYGAHDYLTDVLAGKGLRFIDRASAARKPFLLEIATFAPHAPFTSAPRDAGAFPGVQAPRSPAFNTVGIDEPAWLSSFVPLGPGQLEAIDRKFRRRVQAVQAVDRMIGEIESRLVARGLARDTYIVFSSDNGLHMGEHRLQPGKLTAFDTDIKVPLIVTGPGVAAGRTTDAMTENVDLCPTFDALAGAPPPRRADGRSLVALLHGRAAGDWRTDILVEHHGRVLDAGDPDLPTRGAGNPPSYEAIRTHASLYVEYVTGEREYYDLRRDPFERDNIVARLSPARLGRLHRALVRVERCHGARACWRAQHALT
jgi:N-acetylglucosamine-6-sulfatase